jgi:hypothetical protein
MHLCWPIAGEDTMSPPLRLSFKSSAGRQDDPSPGGGPMAEASQKGKPPNERNLAPNVICTEMEVQ